MKDSEKDYFEMNNGEIQLSLHEETSIHLRSITSHKDPVEMNSEEAKTLANMLLEFAERAS